MANYCPFISTWTDDYYGGSATERLSTCKETDCQLWHDGKCSFRYLPDVVDQLATLNSSVDSIESDVTEIKNDIDDFVDFWRSPSGWVYTNITQFKTKFDEFDARWNGPSGTVGNMYALLAQFDTRFSDTGNFYLLVDAIRALFDEGGKFYDLMDTQLTNINAVLTEMKTILDAIKTILDTWHTEWFEQFMPVITEIRNLHKELTQVHIKRIKEIMEEEWEFAKSMMNKTDAILAEQGILPATF